MIKIIGLGPGSEEALTLGVVKQLKNSDNVFLRTEKHPTVQFLVEEGIKFNTYDSAYENSTTFDQVYESIAVDLIEQHRKFNDITYGVPGHPLVAEKSVVNLINLCKENDICYEILPAVSFIDVMMEALEIDPVEGLKVVDAFDIGNQVLDKRSGIIITQVYNQFIASEVKLKLQEEFNDDTEVYFVRAAGIKGQESIRKMPLYEIDMQEDIDYLTSIYVPKDLDNKKDFYDLMSIIDKLRSEDGCPWDREQTHESLKKALIEESYEVIDAIDKEDDAGMIEELGDVLLQVVFHSSIAKDDGYFNMNDVIQGICEKMINRHPHVFGDESIDTSVEVLEKWEDIKKKEKGFESITEELNSIAKSLPATIRAAKVQSKAKKVGFDWDRVEDAMLKVEEELNEIKEVYNGENRAKIVEEVGDLLFACVNVARFLGVEGELALTFTTEKFIKRFSYIEKIASEKGQNLSDMSLEEMDILWNEAKKDEKN
ncbi:nucleoside triphosphate pyrophosphohydrolase [Clostridium manihotivorum]|uniref:Nucleoside triphosphate pyrophosphohydrolase n=1 Tax=Clostridium manihotivorum TaxID=2320868 RepID=A0A3R5V5J2_9CLOT|nr:nucleoside triphosphate pyrophosphohydrolase [Clostridium manihotivorum]QAA30737.1 nucleoside triphosphate pyrophosphohydrolase [Clostridium manihotivorum]